MKKILALILVLCFLIGCSAPIEPVSDSIEDSETPITATESDHIKVDKAGAIETIEKAPELVIEDTDSLVNPIKEFLLDIPTKYWYHDINDELGAVVVGDKKMDSWRFVGNHIEPGLYYWDYPNSRDVYIFFDEVSMYQLHEVRKLDTPKPQTGDYRLGFIKEEIKGTYTYTWSPIDWMIEYKDSVPYKIDKTPQSIKVDQRSFTSKLSIHFRDAANIETIFRFDDKYHVPVYVEKRLNSQILEQHRFYFDINMYDIQNWRITAEIKEDMADLPENAVIVTLEEAEKLNDLKTGRTRKIVSVKNLMIEIMDGFHDYDYGASQKASI